MKTEAVLSVAPANDMHGGTVPELGPPGSVATVSESGSEITWAMPVGVSVAVAGASLPFDIPVEEPYGVPTGMTYAAPAAEAGDRFLIDAWFEVLAAGNSRELKIAALVDGVDVAESRDYPIAANEAGSFTFRTIYTFGADNASPEFQAGIMADGSGPDVTACTLTITKLAPED